MLSGLHEVWESWFGQSLVSHLGPKWYPLNLCVGVMGNLQPWRGGVVQAAALHASKTLGTDPRALDHDVTKHKHTASCGVVISSSPAPAGSWLKSRDTLRQKRKQKPRLCLVEGWILGCAASCPPLSGVLGR